jgi:tRNA-2-methylthio-N6-dimethylallyladenosine synthase
LAALAKLRAAIPSISVTTDIIVGFPGETEEDFAQTRSLVEEARFDSAYCFMYSPRPGTAAYEMPDDVPESTKEKRVNELLALTERIGREQAGALVGTVQEILLEDAKGNGLFRGKTRSSWRARLNAGSLQLGQLIQARVTGSHSRELHVEPLV